MSVESIVKKLRESTKISEDYLWDTLHPAIVGAIKKVTGDGLDDPSYDYRNGYLRGQGIIFFNKKKDTKKNWKQLGNEIRDALKPLNWYYEGIYDSEKEYVPDDAPFIAYRIYFKAEED